MRGIVLLWMVAVLVSAAVLGCAEEPAVPQAEVAGVRAPQPTEVVAAPAAAATAAPIPNTPEPAVASAPGTAPTSVPAPAPKDVPPWVTQAFSNIYAEAEGFQGVLTVTFHTGSAGPSTMVLREWFRRPNLTKLEVLRSQGDQAPPGSILIYDGKTMSVFNPAEERLLRLSDPSQLALFLHLPSERLFPMLQLFQINQSWPSLAAQSAITVGGQERVANRDTIQLELTPRTATPRFRSLRLWLHKRTNIPLKAEATGLDGSPLFQMEFKEFIPATWDPSTHVGPELFAFTPPVNTEILAAGPDEIAGFLGLAPMGVQEGPAKVGFSVQQPSSPLSETRGRRVWFGRFNGVGMVVLMYGDRQGTSTVLVEKPAMLRLPALRSTQAAAAGELTGEVSQLGDATVVDWVRGGISLSLATTLPSDQALEMARSTR